MDKSPPPLALITGGTSGIGFAIAERLMQDGYDTLITGRDKTRGANSCERLNATVPARTAEFWALNSTDWSAYSILPKRLGSRRISTLVASAAFGQQAHITETSIEVFRDMLAVNVIAPLHLIQTLRPYFVHPSSIILISSDAGIDGEQSVGAYSVTKAALNMLGKMIALDLASEDIRVNVVCPGDTIPGMRYLLRPGEVERSPNDHLSWPTPPRGRIGHPQDTAEFVSFLASPRSDFMVGTVTLVDGGSRAGRPDRTRPS